MLSVFRTPAHAELCNAIFQAVDRHYEKFVTGFRQHGQSMRNFAIMCQKVCRRVTMTEANALPSGHQLRRALAHLLIKLHVHVLPAVCDLHHTQQVSINLLSPPFPRQQHNATSLLSLS